MKPKKSLSNKILKITALILTAVIIFFATALIISNNCLKTSDYTVDLKEISEGNIKLVLLADLHGKSFGKNNSLLIKKISQQKPDIICMCGDFADASGDSFNEASLTDLISELSKTAPVYFSLGNHDISYLKNHEDFIDNLTSSGCTVLENNYTDIRINGVKIRIGGMFGYAFGYDKNSDGTENQAFSFLKDFTDTNLPAILLCHRPDSFIYGNARELWDIDLILSGHTHGGLWRLPFIGGVFAPEQGFNPQYDYGKFEFDKFTMIITSGFDGYKNIPRMFNIPEIAVINLK